MPITYYNNIPDAPNDPSADQPKMQTNTNSTDAIIAIDHYTFADNPSGFHKQVNFPVKNAAVAPAGTDASILYTAAGTAAVNPQLNFVNNLGLFPLSCVRAWGYISGGAAPTIISSQSVNVASVTRAAGPTGVGQYTITLTANAVSSNRFAVLVTGTITANLSLGVIGGYVITGVGTFQINFSKLNGSATADPTNFSFIVLQI